MKQKTKSFGAKLWIGFALFSVLIFAALWLLQTVFLQSFYNRMAIADVRRIGGEIAQQQDSADFGERLEQYASEYSVLIFVTDWQGNVLYSADEHHYLYEKRYGGENTGETKRNPYRAAEGLMSWQIGALHNLPRGYAEFLEQLAASPQGKVGYSIQGETAYIYGLALPASEQWGGEGAALYISMPLGAVGGTVRILRMQLVWVTLGAFLIAFVIACFFSQQFSRPVAELSRQAGRMADGEFARDYKKGFCRELDELSDTLEQTAAALQRLECARRGLLANVSHDLRTPLTMIRGYAEMVRDVSWQDETAREADLGIIIREADRLTELVNDILEYSASAASKTGAGDDVGAESKTGAGGDAGTALEHALCRDVWELDISRLAQQVTEQFRPLCERKGCALEAEMDSGLLVSADGKQLERVFYNLIGNALAHAGDARCIRVVVEGRADVVRVEVQDYGAGIPKEELPYIWDRYFTAKERRRTEEAYGAGVQTRFRSGLGLAITKEILLREQAEFGVESEVGAGSTFWFELPCIPIDFQ